MSDIEELIKLEPYKSCYEYGELKGRAEVIKKIYNDIDDMFYSSETRNLDDLEYGHNQGLSKVQDYLEEQLN